jgi:hypothetical protein
MAGLLAGWLESGDCSKFAQFGKHYQEKSGVSPSETPPHAFSDGLSSPAGFCLPPVSLYNAASFATHVIYKETAMFGSTVLEEISSRISETIANSPAKDVEKNIKAMLGSAFGKMDLVTREEFDIQQQVLVKTRTKLADLEARLARLEAAQPQEAAAQADGAQAV